MEQAIAPDSVATFARSGVGVGPGEGPPAVAAGEVELVLTLISEIVSVPGLELVDPFPSELQGYVSFAAGISLATPNPRTGRALVRVLSGPT